MSYDHGDIFCYQYLALPPVIAPYKCSVLPLSQNADFVPFVRQLCKYTGLCIVHAYAVLCVCVCVCVHMCVCVWMCTHLCKYACLRACVCVCKKKKEMGKECEGV